VVFQNKTPTCQYRGVGHPIACAVTEGLVDLAARKLRMDPLEFRRRNVIPDDAYPATGASGIKLEVLSHEACLRRIEELMDYRRCAAEQVALRQRGIHRGIGFATLIELTNPSAAFYGVGGARIASQDGATLRLDPSGAVTVMASVGEQGQGNDGIFRQIAADAIGVDLEMVRVSPATPTSRPMAAAPGRRAAPASAARPCCWPARPAREHPEAGGGAAQARRSRRLAVRRGHVVDAQTTRRSCCPSPSWAASPTTAPTPCPRTSRRS
jgi:carbon-monoxide dehydrogenase large subunit